MSILIRGLTRLRSAQALREMGITQRANITTKPAKHPIGPVETAIGLFLFSTVIFVPSGWVLVNLESYKKKEV